MTKRLSGRLLAVANGMQLGVRATLRPTDQPPPFFDAHAGRCSVGLQIRCVDHDDLRLALLGSQTRHHPGKDALIAPSFPPVVERLVRAVGSRRVVPAQPIVIDEDNPALDMSTIYVRLRREGLQMHHFRVAQLKKS